MQRCQLYHVQHQQSLHHGPLVHPDCCKWLDLPLRKFYAANTTLLLQSFLSREITCGDVRLNLPRHKVVEHRTVFAPAKMAACASNEEPLPGRSSVHKTRVLHRNYFPALERHIPCTETVAWEEVSSKMSCNWNSGCKHNPERSSTVHHMDSDRTSATSSCFQKRLVLAGFFSMPPLLPSP